MLAFLRALGPWPLFLLAFVGTVGYIGAWWLGVPGTVIAVYFLGVAHERWRRGRREEEKPVRVIYWD